MLLIRSYFGSGHFRVNASKQETHRFHTALLCVLNVTHFELAFMGP